MTSGTSGSRTDAGEYAVIAEARGPTFVPPNALPETEEDKIGFMTTYYPGTPDEAAAQRVRARSGAETPGLEIRMVTGRLFRVSGMVTDSQGRASARTNGQLFKGNPQNTSSYGFSTDEQGRFQMRNIPPGNYRLIVRGGQVRKSRRQLWRAGRNGQYADRCELGSRRSCRHDDTRRFHYRPGRVRAGSAAASAGPAVLPDARQRPDGRSPERHGNVNAAAGHGDARPDVQYERAAWRAAPALERSGDVPQVGDGRRPRHDRHAARIQERRTGDSRHDNARVDR